MATTTQTDTSRSSDFQPQPTGCCAPFDPTPWQDVEVVWQDKLFMKERVHCVLHVPVDMQRVVTRAQARIEAVGASPEQPLFLGEDVSPWQLNLFMEITKEVPDAELVRLSGKYMVKVFDGPFREAPNWMREMKEHVAARGKNVERMFLAYTTCPKCAKAYGHNYVLVFAQVG